MRGVGVTKLETIARQGRKSYIIHRPQVAGFRTMLRAVGTDTKVQQELLHHADIQTTLNTYTQALAPAKMGGAEQGRSDGTVEETLPLLNGSPMGAGEVGGSG